MFLTLGNKWLLILLASFLTLSSGQDFDDDFGFEEGADVPDDDEREEVMQEAVLEAELGMMMGGVMMGGGMLGGGQAFVENDLDTTRFISGRYYHRVYNLINDQLVDGVEDDEIGPNMQFALEWLANEAPKRGNIFNRGLIQGLEQFTSLVRLTNSSMCNRDSYGILRRNDLATGERVHRYDAERNPLRRIDYIVYMFSLNNAIECSTVYPQRYETMLKSFDPVIRGRVETFMKAVINKNLEGRKFLGIPIKKPIDDGDLRAVRSSIGRINKMRGSDVTRIAYETIAMLAKDDPDSRFLVKVKDEKRGGMHVNRDKVIQLARRYLVEPCEIFSQAFGPDIFVPAIYDSLMLKPEDRFYQEDQSKFKEFLYARNYFRLCNILVDLDQKTLVRDLVRYVSKQGAQKV